ncbi:uncharacterized protein LOC108669094 [Hyalella azteca]|uniref:Uncharacterized protein LOC108669094 n=1 Tax=Hyalella azteca TaxID=294128 RepID=A0A8B7NE38_HYAAZ|nr:uncharacterized protein LOC108669094 [Hyalella azteca]
MSVPCNDLFLLEWNDHSRTFLQTLQDLQIAPHLTDAHLACKGKLLPVHKFVLSTCSEYFKDIFSSISVGAVVVAIQDVEVDILESLLTFMYVGRVSVKQEKLAPLIRAAECLRVKGLAGREEALESHIHGVKRKCVDDHQLLRPTPKKREKKRRRSMNDHLPDDDNQVKKHSKMVDSTSPGAVVDFLDVRKFQSRKFPHEFDNPLHNVLDIIGHHQENANGSSSKGLAHKSLPLHIVKQEDDEENLTFVDETDFESNTFLAGLIQDKHHGKSLVYNKEALGQGYPGPEFLRSNSPAVALNLSKTDAAHHEPSLKDASHLRHADSPTGFQKPFVPTVNESHLLGTEVIDAPSNIISEAISPDSKTCINGKVNSEALHDPFQSIGHQDSISGDQNSISGNDYPIEPPGKPVQSKLCSNNTSGSEILEPEILEPEIFHPNIVEKEKSLSSATALHDGQDPEANISCAAPSQPVDAPFGGSKSKVSLTASAGDVGTGDATARNDAVPVASDTSTATTTTVGYSAVGNIVATPRSVSRVGAPNSAVVARKNDPDPVLPVIVKSESCVPLYGASVARAKNSVANAPRQRASSAGACPQQSTSSVRCISSDEAEMYDDHRHIDVTSGDVSNSTSMSEDGGIARIQDDGDEGWHQDLQRDELNLNENNHSLEMFPCKVDGINCICIDRLTDEQVNQRFSNESSPAVGSNLLYVSSRQCPVCSYHTKTPAKFSRHAWQHKRLRTLCCTLCNYRTVLRPSFVVHLRQHTGEKPFKCSYCEYSASQKGNLFVHMKKHQMSS